MTNILEYIRNYPQEL